MKSLLDTIMTVMTLEYANRTYYLTYLWYTEYSLNILGGIIGAIWGILNKQDRSGDMAKHSIVFVISRYLSFLHSTKCISSDKISLQLMEIHAEYRGHVN